MQGVDTITTTPVANKANSSIVFWLSLIFVLLVFGGGAGYLWLVLTDSTGTFHAAADVADLDGDGDLDVLLHNVRQESEFTAFSVATLWFNEGEGRFVARRVEQDAYGGGWASAAGDVDMDGDNDIALFMGYELRLLLNQDGNQEGQSGEFRFHQSIAGPERNGQYGSVLLGDLNNDGYLDGIVAGCCGRLFTIDPTNSAPNVSGVWLNTGPDQGFGMQMTTLADMEGLAVLDAALGDLDGDGDLDLFAAVTAPSEGQNRNPADRVLLNDGGGNFIDSTQRLGDIDSTAVSLGDLDGDGDLDALVGNPSGALVWINQGGVQGGRTGTFVTALPRVDSGPVQALFLADFDGDGDLDALLGERRWATIWWNDGLAQFTKSRQRFFYTKRHGLAVGDFNGDGRIDIFAAAYDDKYRVWFNQGNGRFNSTP
ncbi:MAG: VCBS repeat-containing protein [Ardenticatenaceae bacterium]|nr:VCBS repeat-containing protein [Ardenticatenaceae bacterium]